MLAFDARKTTDDPGLHALIIGVSEYDFFEGGSARIQAEKDGRTIDDPFGYEQLQAAARTAARVAQMLIARKDKLNPPLRTCRLLLSPNADEKAELATQSLPFGSARRDEVLQALVDWRNDAKDRSSDATFFYFSGHGIQQTVGSSFLLLQDLLAGTQPLDHALDLLNVYNGMRNGGAQSAMARTQIYCIDACRNSASGLQAFENLGAAQPFMVLRSGTDDRVAPIYWGAAAGRNTFSLDPHGATLFGGQFLSCFGGSAADKMNFNGKHRWAVTIGGLGEGLSKLSAKVNRDADASIQTFTLSNSTNLDTPLHFLDVAPAVDFILSVNPDAASQFAQIVATASGAPPIKFDCPLDPNPCSRQITAGIYSVEVTITGTGHQFVAPAVDQVGITGPLFEYPVEVQQ